MTMTVMMIEAMTKTMVKSMYFPMSGTALEVEGISSTMTSRNTVRDSKTEILRVIFSPGRHNQPLSPFVLLKAQNAMQYAIVSNITNNLHQQTDFEKLQNKLEGL